MGYGTPTLIGSTDRLNENRHKARLMRIVPIITAILVAGLLFGIVIERDRLFALIDELSPREETIETPTAETETVAVPAPLAEPWAEGVVRVMAKRSVAKELETQVRLRGETQAARQVSVVSEISGKVISEPFRKGAFVKDGQLLCELDPGTSAVSLAEAEARLAEAIARRPEVEARIPEAEARLVEAQPRSISGQVDRSRCAGNPHRRLPRSNMVP